MRKMLVLLTFLSLSISMFATHYINNTGKILIITNMSAKKRYHRKNMWTWGGAVAKKQHKVEKPKLTYFIQLEHGQEGDLYNEQGDEIRITSHGFNDHRKLFPTNNSFNYLITMNKFNKKYERFDINHAG